MRKILLLLTCTILIASCADVEGDDNPPTFTETEHTFPAEGGEYTFAQGKKYKSDWLIQAVQAYPHENDIKTTYTKDVMTVEGTWFVIKRIDEKKLSLKVERNENGKERRIKFAVGLDAIQNFNIRQDGGITNTK